MGVFVVHEFATESVDRKKARQNSDDFSRFVAALFGKQSLPASDGTLIGPIPYSTGPYLPRPVSLLVGKVVFDWRGKASARLLANKPVQRTGR